jgi:hypothetical protein
MLFLAAEVLCNYCYCKTHNMKCYDVAMKTYEYYVTEKSTFCFEA